MNTYLGTTFWGIEAHFRDPSNICATTDDGSTIGDRLTFVNGNSDGSDFTVQNQLFYFFL